MLCREGARRHPNRSDTRRASLGAWGGRDHQYFRPGHAAPDNGCRAEADGVLLSDESIGHRIPAMTRPSSRCFDARAALGGPFWMVTILKTPRQSLEPDGPTRGQAR